MSESASTTISASVLDDKTATVQYKPATGLAGNNNALARYAQSRGYDQISHALSNIHGLYGWSCNLLDVISVYSLYPGKLPGRFSYKRPGYEAGDSPTYKALYLSCLGAKDTTQSLWETLVSLLKKCCCHKNVVDTWDVLQSSVARQ